MKCFVFPLTHVNLFPLTTKPLNIFEPKYLQMVKDSIETQTPIAVAYVPESGESYFPIAGFGFPQIIDHRPNNTMLIFLMGQGKVILKNKETDHDKPYIISECEVIEENLILDEALKSKYMILSQMLVRWVQKHVPDQQQREVFVRSLKGPQEVIGAFAAYLIRDYDMQYEMMELNSLNEQIHFLHRLLESNELTL